MGQPGAGGGQASPARVEPLLVPTLEEAVYSRAGVLFEEQQVAR